MTVPLLLRGLLRSRGFAVTAVVVLGLGLGVNLLLFNTVYALLWRPLGFAEPGRLATLYGQSAGGDLSEFITGQNAWALRQQTEVVAASGIVKAGGQVTLASGDESIEMAAGSADSGYFAALALRPVAGRFFGSEEDAGEVAEERAVLTESAWRSRFAADPSVINRVFPRQDGGRRPVRIIGIAPSSATLPFASEAEIFLPIASAAAGVRENFGDALYRSVVRLQPGVTSGRGSDAVNAAFQAAERGTRFGIWGRRWLEPLRSALAPANHQMVLWLYVSACLLLVLTSANLASLFVARAAARTHEAGVHLALGASHGRLLRASFEEALLVCAAGTGLGFVVENWARPLVPAFIPDLRRIGPELLSTGPVLIAFGFLACLAISVVVAIASSWRMRAMALTEALSQGGRGGPARSGRLRAGLAAAQLAIVLTLLTLGALVARSFWACLQADPGLDPRGRITFRAILPGAQRGSVTAISEVQRQIASVPGVRSVAFAAEGPIGAPAFSTVTAAHGGDLVSSDPMLAYRLVGSTYFEAIGARLTAGRPFTEDEIQQGRPVAILNHTAARLLFRGQDPIGRVVHSGFMGRQSLVVGVVKDIRSEGLDRPPAPMVYIGYLPGMGLRFVVRTDASAGAFVPMVKSRVRAWNGAVSLQQFRPLEDTLKATVRARIVASILVGGFALLGLIVSAVGLYGTLAAHVQERRREIGIRVALGATAGGVVRHVLTEGARIVALGSTAGIASSAIAARLIREQLYGVGPLDAGSFLIAVGVLSAAAVAACLVPALRARRIDPVQMLNAQ